MTDTLESLKIQAKIISMESSSGGQLLSALPNRLPGFVSSVKDFVSNFMSSETPVIVAISKDRSLEEAMRHVTYVDLMELKVSVPIGLTCSFMNYMDAVEKGLSVAEHLSDEVLRPTIRWAASLLSDPTRLASVTRSKEYAAIQFQDLEKVKKEMAKCFSDKSISDLVPYGQVVANNKQWQEAMLRMNALQTRYIAISREKILEEITEITSALETLFSRVENEPDVYKISGKTMQEIANIAIQVAEHAEFFSVFSFQMQQLSQSMEDTKQVLITATHAKR